MSDPVPTIRVLNPDSDDCVESRIPRELSDLYSSLRGLPTDGGINSCYKSCLKTEVALRFFDLCGGYDIRFEDGSGWRAFLQEVYSYDELQEGSLSPARSVLVVCLATANGVYTELECMKNKDTTLFVGSRKGKYKPVVLIHRPKTNKALDVTKAVVLVTPGTVSRFCGSYDLTDDKYYNADGRILENVDDYFYKLGKGAF